MPRAEERIVGRAYARVGLLGNPSDQYGGKTVAFSLANFEARVALEPAERLEIVRGEDDSLDAASFTEMGGRLRELGCYDGVRLLRAAIARFDTRFPQLRALPLDDPRQRFRIRYTSEIPRQAGLAGSSAIIIAALRALATHFEVEIPPAELAEIALAAESHELGIAAGPMDRVIQAYEGLMWMDFAEPRGEFSYRRLDPALLPPLFVAWNPRVGEASGIVHNDVRLRWQRGDTDVREAMRIFPALVDEGTACLERGDTSGLRRVVNHNFDTRASIFSIGAADLEMVRIGRSLGAGVKLCGSGGAVVGVLPEDGGFAELESALSEAGYRVLRPTLHPTSEHASCA